MNLNSQGSNNLGGYKSTQIKSKLMLVFEEGENLEYLGKNCSEQSREPTNYDVESGNPTWDTLLEGRWTYTTAPALLPKQIIIVVYVIHFCYNLCYNNNNKLNELFAPQYLPH